MISVNELESIDLSEREDKHYIYLYKNVTVVLDFIELFKRNDGKFN